MCVCGGGGVVIAGFYGIMHASSRHHFLYPLAHVHRVIICISYQHQCEVYTVTLWILSIFSYARGSESCMGKLRLHYGDFVQANFNMADKTAGQLHLTLRVNQASTKAFEPRST